MKFRFNSNTDELISSLIRLEKKGADEIRDKMLSAGGMALLQDINTIDPKPPVDTGNLRGSGSVFVGNKLIHAETYGNSSHTGRPGVATVGLDTPYAAKHHNAYGQGRERDRFKKHTKPQANTDSGPGFIVKKLPKYANEWSEIAGEVLKKEL